MNLNITRIIDHQQQNERVEIAVTADCNLRFYILADTTYKDASHISNKLRHMHWFTDKNVIAGDQVVLYTKKGTDRAEKINEKNTRYYIYWKLDNSVWNDTGDGAILFDIDSWKTVKTK